LFAWLFCGFFLDVLWFWCGFIAGGGMGIFMGMLFGALEQPVAGDTMTARQHFVHAARTMSTKSVQMAKTFAVMGAIFAGTECVFEKVECCYSLSCSPSFCLCLVFVKSCVSDLWFCCLCIVPWFSGRRCLNDISEL
jgi:hypothetical protein